MKEVFIITRNKTLRFFYNNFLKTIFFRLQPEIIHDRMVSIGSLLGANPLGRFVTSMMFSYSDKRLEQDILGIRFKNPIGLAGGFDKNGQLTEILPSVGFGFMEIGSVTGEPCEGNPKPRLWRLKSSKSLLVWYGLKNDGAEVLSKKLKSKNFSVPLGTNIAKTNSKSTVKTNSGIADYAKAFDKFKKIGSYFTVNISCPNAFGGQPFTDPVSLDVLLGKLDKIQTKKPVFLKFSPDLGKKQIDDLIGVCNRHRVHGFICTNLTKNRNNKKILDAVQSTDGGMSGKVVEKLSNDMLSYIYKKTKGKYIMVGLGGVFNAEDAYRKIRKGASLVQLITGMIFEGPQVISEINLGLVKLLEKDGYSSISDAVGADFRY